MGRGKRKPYHDKFRLIRKYGHFYVVCRMDPGGPKSTHVPIDEGEEKALDWAYRNLDVDRSGFDVTLGSFATGFLDPDSTWTRRK